MEKRLINKLIEIGISEPEGNFSTEEIALIEKEYEITLPDDYKEFLQKYGGTYITRDGAFVSEHNSKSYCATFYGSSDNQDSLKRNIEEYLERMPSSIIPFADADGGDKLCIGVKGDAFRKIYFWNHEKELEAYRMLNPDKTFPSIDNYWNNLEIVANSLTEFILSYKIEEKATENITSNVEAVFSDKLLEMLKNRKNE